MVSFLNVFNKVFNKIIILKLFRSFGILLYELITLGAEPYPNMNRQEVIYEVGENNYRMQKPEGLCTDAYYAIMIKCWNEEPQRRPTFDALFHFFNDYVINTQPQYQMTVPNQANLNQEFRSMPIIKKKSSFWGFFKRKT